MTDWVIDTSVLLTGREPPPGAWWTTAEADAEVSTGGRDARRYAAWREVGMAVVSPAEESRRAVDAAAAAAGNLARLSPADRSLLALALEKRATLVTDDRTMLDVAARLDLHTLSLGGHDIDKLLDWQARCAGCGRWFDEAPPADCPVCGSEVRMKPRR